MHLDISESLPTFFLQLGLLWGLGLLAEFASRRTILPRATLLLVIGIVLGPAVLGVYDSGESELFPALSHLALVMIGFLLGGQFTRRGLHDRGRTVLVVSITEAVITTALVSLGLLLAGFAVEIALVFGAIAAATAPAATIDVITGSEAKGRFTETLRGVVAIDDLWGLLLFSGVLAFVIAQTGHGGGEVLSNVMRDIGGAALVGLVIGLPAAALTGRLQRGEPTLIEALAVVFLCAGLALRFDVSYLIASMVTGAVIANLARHHDYPFHAIENIDSPFLIIFFIVAGASLDLSALASLGVVGACYVGLRVAGRMIGGFTGGYIAGTSRVERRWLGLALLPQAGVAIGMALHTEQRAPDLGGTILPVIIATTVVFELFGPVFTRMALVKAGDVSTPRSSDTPAS